MPRERIKIAKRYLCIFPYLCFPYVPIAQEGLAYSPYLTWHRQVLPTHQLPVLSGGSFKICRAPLIFNLAVGRVKHLILDGASKVSSSLS